MDVIERLAELPLDTVMQLLDEMPNWQLCLNSEQIRLKDTLLTYTVRHCPKVTRLLLELGADPNPVDASGRSPLWHAINSQNHAMIELLLRNGADPNLEGPTSPEGRVSLVHRAMQLKDDLAVKLLLEYGADITRKTHLMSWAIQQRRLSLAEDFIEAGMDVSVEPEPFATVSPLYAAIKGRFLGLNKQLISKGATHCWHKVDGAINKTTPLHASMYSGDIEMVNFFLDEGREINEGDDDGATPLHRAVENGFQRAVKVLLEHGADVNATYEASSTRSTATALTVACTNRHVNIAKLLLAHGASATFETKDGTSALAEAVKSGSFLLVKSLVEHDACFDSKKVEPTALDLVSAIVNDHLDIAMYLTEHGANLDCSCPKTGMSIVHYAIKTCSLSLLELAIARGAKLDVVDKTGMTPLLQACQSVHNHAITKRLLQAGADPNHVALEGRAALSFVAARGIVRDVELLIRHGADVNASDKWGNTAMHRLNFYKDQIDNISMIIQILLASGADINAQNVLGRTKLHSQSLEVPMAELLLDLGANVNIVDKDGFTPLHCAADRSDVELVRLLLTRGADVNADALGGGRSIDRVLRRSHHSTDRHAIITMLLGQGAEPILAYKRKCATWKVDHEAMHRAIVLKHSWTAQDIWRLRSGDLRSSERVPTVAGIETVIAWIECALNASDDLLPYEKALGSVIKWSYQLERLGKGSMVPLIQS